MAKKVLFIDRDGTIIVEPPATYQVDTLEQLVLLPGVIRNLYRISREMDIELVMVTNQDGLGTDNHPEENFNTVQNKMLEILENEGIKFSAIYVDRSFPEENKPTRKPGIAMLQAYTNGNYDMTNSFTIGDRITDIIMAKNLGCKSILLLNDNHTTAPDEQATYTVPSWDEIYRVLRNQKRTSVRHRKTLETDIAIELNLDGTGSYQIHTGIGFFDHMLEQLAKHSGIDLSIQAAGDLHIDEHHTIEDVAITLGECFLDALGKKTGINRYGFCLPMDDCLAQVAIDFSGRPWLVWETTFNREKVGDMPTELFFHFFKSFSDAAKCNLNIKTEGVNEHHKIEAIFKAFAKSIAQAIQENKNSTALPTTKGLL